MKHTLCKLLHRIIYDGTSALIFVVAVQIRYSGYSQLLRFDFSSFLYLVSLYVKTAIEW
jgi:hypothetical protein